MSSGSGPAGTHYSGRRSIRARVMNPGVTGYPDIYEEAGIYL